MISYKTSSPLGDLISFLSGIKQIWLDTGEKGVLYHRLNMVGHSYDGAEPSAINENGLPICFNKRSFDMMRPLLLSQPYVEDYIIYSGQPYEIDFDKVRLENYTNQPKGSLNRWVNHVFPQMACNLAESWVDVPYVENINCENKILINITHRHRNYFVDYFFLKKHEGKMMFAGMPKERDDFCKEFSLNIPLLTSSNFYELAVQLKTCKFVIANQSFVFQLCEAIKIPRMLELFPSMPNVIPIGDNAFDYYHNEECQLYFEKLLNL